MAATATAEKPRTADAPVSVASVLELNVMTFDELRAKGVTDFMLAQAWAKGEIEFGRAKHIVTGPVGKDSSALVIEGEVEWPNPRLTYEKKPFRDFIAEELAPKVGKYKKYVLEMQTSKEKDIWVRIERREEAGSREVRNVAVEIDAAEALAAMRWLVRLTEKGVAQAA